MRKNSRIITLAVAAAVMMAVTACGSKDKTETTASTEATTEAVTTTAAAETSLSEAESTEAEDQTEEGKRQMRAEEAAEETTASASGEIGSDGVFQAANGKFEIKVPAGWTIDEGSDDEYVTFLSQMGRHAEIMTISGSSADSVREIYPDTAEEYKNMVSRGDGMEILSYDVNTKGMKPDLPVFHMKYTNPSDGIHYLAESGTYDAAKQTYSCNRNCDVNR